jgi:hypothetical protein
MASEPGDCERCGAGIQGGEDSLAGEAMRVDVYRNLNVRKHRAFSIRHKGRVVAVHYERLAPIFLAGVKYVVNPAGRERVRRTGRKNVHAFVRGELRDFREAGPVVFSVFPGTHLTYDPRKNETFVSSIKGPVEASEWATVQAADQHSAVFAHGILTQGSNHGTAR